MPPIRKNGCGKQLPQPKTHTTPADRQAMTTHRAERYTNFPRKAQRTGRSAPPDTMSCRSSAGNQVHPLNSSLIFSYPTTRAAKKQPPFAAYGSFYRLKHGKDRRKAVFSCILKTTRWASGSKKAAADEEKENSLCYSRDAVWQLQTTKQREAIQE